MKIFPNNPLHILQTHSVLHDCGVLWIRSVCKIIEITPWLCSGTNHYSSNVVLHYATLISVAQLKIFSNFVVWLMKSEGEARHLLHLIDTERLHES